MGSTYGITVLSLAALQSEIPFFGWWVLTLFRTPQRMCVDQKVPQLDLQFSFHVINHGDFRHSSTPPHPTNHNRTPSTHAISPSTPSLCPCSFVLAFAAPPGGWNYLSLTPYNASHLHLLDQPPGAINTQQTNIICNN